MRTETVTAIMSIGANPMSGMTNRTDSLWLINEMREYQFLTKMALSWYLSSQIAALMSDHMTRHGDKSTTDFSCSQICLSYQF